MAESKEAKLEAMSTADMALKCAEFFMSLGEYCLEFYHKHNKEVERKTKVIKKAKRAKGRPKKDGEEADNNDDDMAKKIPKKPLTAYIIYFQQKKPNFVDKHPGLNLSELTKLIAKEWKEINDEERRPYLEQAQDDRKRFDEEMRQFKAKYGTANQEDDDEEEEQNGNQEAPAQSIRSEAKQSSMKVDAEDDLSEGEEDAEEGDMEDEGKSKDKEGMEAEENEGRE